MQVEGDKEPLSFRVLVRQSSASFYHSDPVPAESQISQADVAQASACRVETHLDPPLASADLAARKPVPPA
jgi:hypothetical protein